EIPLLLRLLRGRLVFSELVAQVLSLDYAGALVASLLFPLLLVPRLGLIRTSLLIGLANAAVGLWSTWIFRHELGRTAFLRGLDGLDAREILRYPAVESVTLVDLDPEMTRLFGDNPLLRELNGGALTDRRLRVVNADAFIWLSATQETFDVAIVDFPDPHNFS